MMTTDIQAVPDRLRLLAEELRTFEHPRPYSILSIYCQRQVFGVGSVEFSFSQHIENERARLQRFINRQLTAGGLLLSDVIAAGVLPDDFEFLPIIDGCNLSQQQRRKTANPGHLGRFCEWALIQFWHLRQAGIIDSAFPCPPSRRREPIPATERPGRYRAWVADSLEALGDFIEQRASDHHQPQTEELTSCS